MTTPEQSARIQIDAQLSAAGWAIQDLASLNLHASRGVAIREMQSHGGPADYILFVDGKALGIVEAKKEGTTLSAVAEQSARYTADVIGKVIVLLRMYVLRSQKKSLLAAEDAKEKSRRRGNDSSQPVPISPLSALSSQISLVGV